MNVADLCCCSGALLGNNTVDAFGQQAALTHVSLKFKAKLFSFLSGLPDDSKVAFLDHSGGRESLRPLSGSAVLLLGYSKLRALTAVTAMLLAIRFFLKTSQRQNVKCFFVKPEISTRDWKEPRERERDSEIRPIRKRHHPRGSRLQKMQINRKDPLKIRIFIASFQRPSGCSECEGRIARMMIFGSWTNDLRVA